MSSSRYGTRALTAQPFTHLALTRPSETHTRGLHVLRLGYRTLQPLKNAPNQRESQG